jgi:hypothetical protein
VSKKRALILYFEIQKYHKLTAYIYAVAKDLINDETRHP